MRSLPFCVFGKAMTSLMFVVFTRCMTTRSSPRASPPCGGAPKASASRRKPNFSLASSGVNPSSAKIRDCRFWSWILIDPPPISEPLTTRSYASESTFAVSDSNLSISSTRGEVNGWWRESQRFSSSFHSSAGKSTTQTHCQSPSLIILRSCASLMRSSPSVRRTILPVSAAKQRRSPSLAPVRSTSSGAISCMNFAMPVSTAPSLPTLATAKPLAPKSLTKFARASVCLRVMTAPPGTQMAFTLPPAARAFLNTLNSVFSARSAMSTSSMPKRRSGRSEP